MIEKYKNRYRTASARANWWSYGWPGAYFITICTIHRRHFFGRIVCGKIVLSPIGKLANQFWFEIPNHAHNVELGAFQVMPNHIHGILILRGWSEADTVENIDSVGDMGSVTVPVMVAVPGQGRDKACLVPTNGNGNGNGNDPTTIPRTNSVPKSQSQSRFQNQGKNTVSSIIGGYKSVVTKYAHQYGYIFDWQSRFHDHIIRGDEEYQRINDYIESNPRRWRDDRLFSSCKKQYFDR